MNYWLFAFTFLLHSAPVGSSNEVRWSADRKLTFSDFQGNDLSDSQWCANTSTSMYFHYDLINGQLKNISAYSTFVPSESWMKKNIPAVLDHEQLHFDITEYCSRKFCAEAATYDGCPHEKTKLKQLFNEVNKECDQMQQLYDDETAHGLNRDAQQQWSNKMNELLKESTDYTARK